MTFTSECKFRLVPLLGFADPSVNFALQFQVLEDFAENDTPVESETALITDSNGNEKEAVATIKSDHQGNNVVTLDTFRRLNIKPRINVASRSGN